MFIKVLISVFIWLNIHLVYGAPDSVRSSRGDAEQAFQELLNLNTQLLQAALPNMSRTVEAELQILIDRAVKYIYTETQIKVNETKVTILKNLQMLEDFGLDSSVCRGTVFNQLDDFFKKIVSRLTNCSPLSATILRHWLNKTSEEMPNIGASVLSCNSRNIAQCAEYNVDDTCYDAVIDGIEKAKSVLSLNYEIMTTAFFTKIADYQLPCQDLLNYEVARFLSSRMETVRNCVAIQLKLAQQSSCYLS